MSSLSLKIVNFDHEDFSILVSELNTELWVRYPNTQQNSEPFNKIDETCCVVVAYSDNIPVGCGCFRPKPSATIEIKRMYVRSDFRNQGIAKMLLAKLETIATERGFHRSILETANKQPEAFSTYQKSSYQVIPNFPPYENMKDSICMEKILVSTPAPSPEEKGKSSPLERI